MAHLRKATDGHLAKLVDGHLANTDGPSCDFDALAFGFELSGYSDGDLVPCVGCLTGTAPTWLGTFGKSTGTPTPRNCYWNAQATHPFLTNIVDKRFDKTSGVEFLVPICTWRLLIDCFSLNIWTGTKLTGDSPVGVFTRTGGCAAVPATLTVVES